MSTTTIRLEDDLKARVVAVAEQSGKTTHAFLLEAIASTVEQAEVDARFRRLAETRWKGLLRTGETIAWTEGRRYLERRARGEDIAQPVPRKLAE